MHQCRGRFAPSPAGEMHLGNAWTALMAWLQVRKLGGTMVLRIEDLDPERSRPVYTAQIMEDLRWLGLDWDEGPDVGGPYGPYNQELRRHLYNAALRRLDDGGWLYPCYCTRAEMRLVALAPHPGEAGPSYPGTCRNLSKEERTNREADGRRPSLRFQVPPGTVSFYDLGRGMVTQNVAREVGDFIVRRSDGQYAYQLAVVVDDAAMAITHVLRGDDLLDSTPRQLLLYRTLALAEPCFTHVPLLYGGDGRRLSKRHGDLSVAALRRRGIKPETIIGYLAFRANFIPRMEPVRPQEIVDVFSLDVLPQGPVVVNDFPA